MPQARATETEVRATSTHRAAHRHRHQALVTALVVAALVTGAIVWIQLAGSDEERAPRGAVGPQRQAMPRAFSPDSWWNTPLPATVPLDPAGPQILDYLRTGRESGRGCLMLAGAEGSHWGHPIYWAGPGDPAYAVQDLNGAVPPELERLRIPRGAQPGDNNDGSMTVYDTDRGYVVALTDAEHDGASDTWSASGATVTYLDSNGLDVRTGYSDDPRNRGTHRGNNGAVMAVGWHEVQRGAIRHVLKVAAGPEVANRHIFPMTGSDGDYEGSDPSVPPEGLRLRIKPSVDLDSLQLHPEAVVIAEALQRYGFYIGDSGGTTALKLENTRAEGRGQLWDLPPDALCQLPFTEDFWDVVDEDFNQPGRVR